MKFKGLKSNISIAIKESCYYHDARFYNIANQVPNILTYSMDPKSETAEGLTRIVDQTICEAAALDCDMSVIVKGILLGAYRSAQDDSKDTFSEWEPWIRDVIISVFKYKGNIKKAVEGSLAAILATAYEHQLNEKEAMIAASEVILSSASSLDPASIEQVKAAIPKSNDPS